MYLQVLVFYKPDILRVIVVSVIGVNVSFHGFGFTLCRGNTQKKKVVFTNVFHSYLKETRLQDVIFH